ncbi:MAG: hypothetical protein ACPGID_11850 [Rubricella sp.]
MPDLIALQARAKQVRAEAKAAASEALQREEAEARTDLRRAIARERHVAALVHAAERMERKRHDGEL